MSQIRLSEAATAWLNTMRREWLKRYPDKPENCPIRLWEGYSPEDQSVMMRATNAAIAAYTTAAA